MKSLIYAAALGAALVSSAASAQSLGTYRVRAGLGAQLAPEWIGAKSEEVSPYFSFSVAKGDHPFGFSAPGDSGGPAILHSGGFELGPAFRLSQSRKDKDVGEPLGKVSRGVEVGGFVNFYPVKSIRIRGELRKAFGGHKGLAGFVGADQIWRDGDKYVVSIGPRLYYGSSRYERAYFGVTPEAALATGLPEYNPGGGFNAVGATAGMQYAIGKNWGLFGYARYKRFTGDSKRSPIIQEFGSPNQFSVGIGVSRTFTIKL
jgi:outer membrane protein